jgi:hypothetical protein
VSGAGAKGQALEREFAAWMESSLNYTSTKQRDLVNGNIAKRPYEVDVHGERFSQIWNALRIGSLLFIALAMAAYFWPDEMSSVNDAAESAVSSLAPSAAGSGLVIMAFVAFVAGYVGKKKATTHAWVECKDRKTSVKRADIEKLRGAVQDVQKNPRAPWKPNDVIMVSGSGFDHDAISLARTYGIVCYQRNGAGFERV